MINIKMNENSVPSKQLKLWDNIVADPGPSLKAAMNETLKGSPLSREQVVDDMNRMALIAGITCGGRGRKVITLPLLNKWLAPGATAHHIPIRLLSIFCRAVQNILPLQVYASFFQDTHVVSNDDLKKLQWAESEIEARKNRKKASRLAQEVGL